MRGHPSIETERELVEIPLKVTGRCRSLMGPRQPPFQQRDDQVDVLEATYFLFASSCDDGFLVRHLEAFHFRIRFEPVRDNRRSRLYVVFDEGRYLLPAGSTDQAEPDSPKLLLRKTFDCDKNKSLSLRSAAASTFFLSADVCFIQLDPPLQQFPPRADHDATELLQPTPCGLVAAKAKGVHKVLGAHARLLGHHQPNYVVPQPERFPTVFKDRSCRRRTLMPAGLTVPEATLRAPCVGVSTARAFEAIAPAYPFEVFHAVRFRRKPIEKFLKSLGIWGIFCCFHGRNDTLYHNLSQSATQFF